MTMHHCVLCSGAPSWSPLDEDLCDPCWEKLHRQQPLHCSAYDCPDRASWYAPHPESVVVGLCESHHDDVVDEETTTWRPLNHSPFHL